MTEQILCARCGEPIPPKRLEIMPKTVVCVSCSEAIGGEESLEVTLGSTGKQGSLKLTGQKLDVKLKRKKGL
jgi:hypothetical protein